MYRYSLDNTVAYSSEDIVLFKESPFASWMERLTLESPQHGIAPDSEIEDEAQVASVSLSGHSESDRDRIEAVQWEKLVELRQAPLQPAEAQLESCVRSLSGQGKVVVVVDAGSEECHRRTQTIDAMKRGADLIVNAQLASGPLSDTASLLMRRSGFSDFGNYLYIPCDTSAVTTADCAFRLCFLADLLHSLQGQLPPQMLIIRADTDVVSLQVEDHIYYYRGVKQRFMAAQMGFRKHRMPDPADSSHFGRWSQCATDVLKQRASGDQESMADENVEPEEFDNTPPVAANCGAVAASAIDVRAAPPPNLRPPLKTEQAVALQNPLLTPQDQPFDLDAGLSVEAVEQYRTPSLTASLVDRDQIIANNEAAPPEATSTELPLGKHQWEHFPEYSKKAVRPISSVLITCPQGDY